MMNKVGKPVTLLWTDDGLGGCVFSFSETDNRGLAFSYFKDITE
jgi:hypothetical protein